MLQGNDAQRALGRRARGCSLFFRGEFEAGWESFRQAIDLWDVDKAREEILVYGEDPSVICRGYGSWVLWSLGYPDASSQLMSKALTDAERLSNSHIYAFALGLAAAKHVLRNEFPQAIERADASLAIGAEQGFPQWTSYAMIFRGRGRAALGQIDEGLADMERGWADWQSTRRQTRYAASHHQAGGVVFRGGPHRSGPRLDQGRHGAFAHVPRKVSGRRNA